MSDATKGVLTTRKLQAMLEVKLAPEITDRKALARSLTEAGEPISVEGVHAWFKHQDSNYAFDRKSLSRRKPSYEIPARRRARHPSSVRSGTGRPGQHRRRFPALLLQGGETTAKHRGGEHQPGLHLHGVGRKGGALRRAAA